MYKNTEWIGKRISHLLSHRFHPVCCALMYKTIHLCSSSRVVMRHSVFATKGYD